MIGNIRVNFRQCTENFQKSSETSGKCLQIFRKLLNPLNIIIIYKINRILHVQLWIAILSSRVQLDITRLRCAHL